MLLNNSITSTCKKSKNNIKKKINISEKNILRWSFTLKISQFMKNYEKLEKWFFILKFNADYESGIFLYQSKSIFQIFSILLHPIFFSHLAF